MTVGFAGLTDPAALNRVGIVLHDLQYGHGFDES